MFIILIILITLVIIALKATLIGITAAKISVKAGIILGKAGKKSAEILGSAAKKVRGSKIEISRKSKTKLRSGIEDAAKVGLKAGKQVLKSATIVAVNTYEASVKILIFILKQIRRLMYTLATAFGLIDVALAFVIVLACAYYIMYLSDGKYTPTNAPANATSESTSSSTSDKKEGESSSSGDIDTSKIGGNPNFDGQGKKERKKLVEKILAEWPKKYGDKVTKKRKKLVQAAVDSLGVTLQYSQSSSFRQVNPKDTPTCTDCSGFVCWCYYKAGYNNVGGYTGGMKDSFFKKISEDELLPGDVGFSNDLGGTSGSSDHTGLFIGELDGQYYFIHCTSNGQVIQYGSDGVAQKHGGTKVNTAGDAHLPCFWRLKKW